ARAAAHRPRPLSAPRVAALGGRDNAFTSRDATGYYQQIPSDTLEDVMRLEADRFANNQWVDDEFKREIEVVKEERRSRTQASPIALMLEAATGLTFTASPYRRPIVGWMSDLDAMTAQDVRNFYQRWYVPGNAAVVVSGDVEVAEVRRLAVTYYGPIAARPVPVRKPQDEPVQAGPRRMDFKGVASQAYVNLAFKVPKLQAADFAGDEQGRDAVALTVLASVLDGFSGARLARALEQGDSRLADRTSAYNGLMGRGPQLFVLSGVPAPGKTAAQVAAGLRQQIALIAQEGISDEELNRVKVQWVASETYKLDSVFYQARQLGSNWINGLPLDADTRLLSKLRSITSAEVQRVAAKYFGDDQMTVATLVPQPIDPKLTPRVAPALSKRHSIDHD
ncbi:MAG: pitrilysin family protein, partial [Burkholderiaceae bacterium]